MLVGIGTVHFAQRTTQSAWIYRQALALFGQRINGAIADVLTRLSDVRVKVTMNSASPRRNGLGLWRSKLQTPKRNGTRGCSRVRRSVNSISCRRRFNHSLKRSPSSKACAAGPLQVNSPATGMAYCRTSRWSTYLLSKTNQLTLLPMQNARNPGRGTLRRSGALSCGLSVRSVRAGERNRLARSSA